MTHAYLESLVAVPFAFAVLAILVRRDSVAVGLSVLGSALVLGWSIPAVLEDRSLDHVWIESLGVHWSLALDGISAPLVLLTTIVTFCCQVALVKHGPHCGGEGRLAALLMLIEAGVIGAFLATDMVLFFLFFEVALIPMWFVINVWGDQHDPVGRRAAATRFLLFTVLGSALMLVGFVLLRSETGTFDILAITADPPSGDTVTIAAVLVGIGLAVKTPLFPVHIWLPDAHAKAPTVGSVILAALLLKLGTYGFIRFWLPIVDPASAILPTFAALAVVGIVYGALACLAQTDLKRLIAYSSVGHMGFVVLAIATYTTIGVQAAVYASVAHGLITGLLFFAAGAIKDRYDSSDLAELKVLYGAVPRLAGVMAFGAIASLGLPGLAGFWGEMLAIRSALYPDSALPEGTFVTFSVIAALGVILTTTYFLKLMRGMLQGERRSSRDASEASQRVETKADVHWLEWAAWSPLIVLTVVLGVAPSLLLEPVSDALTGGGPVNGPQSIDWLAVTPPLVLAGAAIVVLLADAFLGPARSRREAHLPAVLTLAAVIGSGSVAAFMWDDQRSTFCVEPVLDGPVGCSLVVDRFTLVFWAITLFGTAVVALLGTAAIADGRTPPGEWNFLLLSSATGAMVIASARDLITLVVALEVVSLPAFAMAGLRHGDRKAAEASLKFFLVSVISTAVTLMGISLVYGVTGSVFFDQINASLAVVDEARDVAIAGTLLTIVGLAFKVAAVPFHMWVPDTYVGAPVAVAAYLSVVSKAAGFVGLMLVLTFALPEFTDQWSPVVAVLAALTMTVGNVLALRQTHAVRLLAWSSVAQAGYVLVPFGAVADSGVGEEVLGASIGYLAIYAVINLGAFAVATLVGTRHHGQSIEDYRGLVQGEPGAGWALAFALVALAGLPPGIVGLIAKVVVLDVAAGPATWLALVMAVNVAIGLVYYARWLMVLFTPAEDEHANVYDVPTGLAVAIGATLTAGIVFSVFPGWVLDNAVAVLG